MCILESILLFLAEIVKIDVAEAGTKNNEICSLLSKLCFLHLLHLFTFCWHTGDNVRLSDVVKFNSVWFLHVMSLVFVVATLTLLWLRVRSSKAGQRLTE